MPLHSFMVAYFIYNLAIWTYNTALPILVVQKFGIGSKLVGALVLQVVPRILCGPLVGTILFKIVPTFTAWIAMLCLFMSMVVLPHLTYYSLFQGAILWTGILVVPITASLCILRSCVIPPGQHITINARLSLVENLAQVIGPASTGLFSYSIVYVFYAMGLLLVLSAILVLLLAIKPEKELSNSGTKNTSSSYRNLIALLYKKPVLQAIFIPALGYAILLGTMNPFLLWFTSQTWQSPENKWTLLLTAQGIGAIIGSFTTPRFMHWLNTRTTTLHSYLWIRLLKNVWLIGLVWVTSFLYAVGILLVAGVLEAIACICFFTLLPRNLSYQQEAIFHTLSFPVFTTFIALGTCLGVSYTSHWLSLQAFWALAIGLASLSIFPFIVYKSTLLDHKQGNTR